MLHNISSQQFDTGVTAVTGASREQGVNRGIRSILPPYATSPSSAPSHTRWAGLFPPIKTNKTHFLATNLPNRKIFWCILAICIPNREVVYLPEQMTRVTLALCSAPYDCALAHCPDGIHIQSGHFVPALAGPS